MFSVALAHWSITVSNLIESLEDQICTLIKPGQCDLTTASNISVKPIIFLSLNVVLSDIVVLWRVYAAWDRRYWVLALCSLLPMCTLTLTIIFIKNAVLFNNGSIQDTFVTYSHSGFENTELGIAVLTASLLSNVCATTLIALKAWHHRREISRMNAMTRRTLVERVLTLLIESGFVYSCIWVLYVISSTSNLLDTQFLEGFFPADYINLNLPVPASFVFDNAMAQITSIYPTILIILISLGRIQHQEVFLQTTHVHIPVQAPQSDASQLVTINVDIDIERSAGTIRDSRRYSVATDGVYTAYTKAE